jgi:hypothetical protein
MQGSSLAVPSVCVAALFFAACPLFPQTLDVAPKAVKLLQVQGGPAAWARISVTSTTGTPQAWTATADNGSNTQPWITLTAPSGVTPATIEIGIIGWRGGEAPAGKTTGSVTVKSDSASVTVPVEWEVRPANPAPRFTYLAGPTGCASSPGYPDPPLCTPQPLPAFPGAADGAPPPGAAYTDPNFGAHVRVMTPPGDHHDYSTPSPLSAHNKYLMVFKGAFDILDAVSGKTVVTGAPGNESLFWDANDDEVYYYIRGAVMLKHDLRTGKDSVLVDYAKQPEHFQSIERGGTGDTSKDNWITFWAGNEKKICALDLTQVRTYCADYAATQGNLPYGKIDFTLITKGTDKASGKRYVMLIAPPAMGIFSVDLAAGVLKPEFRGPENVERGGNRDGKCDPGENCFVGSHIDTMEDSAGVQYIVGDFETSAPCEVAVDTYQLNKGLDLLKQAELGGGRRRVMTLWRCGPGWVDLHTGCAKAAPYCVISTQAPKRNPADTSPIVPTPHANEIIVMRENGVEIRRIALTRAIYYTDAGDLNYWVAARAALSNDGSLVVADTNFGVHGVSRSIMIETGYPSK